MATLYRKYRPQQWSDVAGQTPIVTTLTNALKNNLLAQSYLLTGPRGTGKTTVARLLAKSINCTARHDGKEPCGKCANCLAFEEGRAFDISEIDGASNNSVENIRELRETVKLPPSLGAKKIYIIDEVHMLSTGAWNALLKTLEEPPAHVVFILATTELHKIPDTILSRCQRFDLSAFSTEVIVAKLARIAREEGIVIDTDAVEMIALSAEGGMRDAESLLAQVISLEDAHITGNEVASLLGISERKTVFEFVDALGRKDLDASIVILESLSQKGTDFRSFAGALTHFLRELLFRKLGKNAQEKLVSRAFAEEHASLEHLAALFSFPELARLMEIIHHARKEIRFATIQHLPLEIATLTFLFPKNASPEVETPHVKTPLPTHTLPVSPPSPPPSPLRKIAAPSREIPIASEGNQAPHATPPQTPPTTIAPQKESEKKEEPLPSLPLSLIQEKWSLFLEEAKRRNASLTLSLSNGFPKASEPGRLTISVNRLFHKERLEKPENRLTVEDALATIFGVKTRLAVECAPEESIPDDPLLDSALNILGGKIV